MEEFYRTVIGQFSSPMEIKVEKTATNSNTFYAPSSGFNIKFILGHKAYISFKFSRQDSDQLHTVTRASLPKSEISFTIFDSRLSNARRVIGKQLENVVTTPAVRQRLMEMALETASMLIKIKPPNHNSISIDLCLHVSFEISFDETRRPTFEEGQWREFRGYTDPDPDFDTCSICLNDFSDIHRSDFTPCGHKFHRDCINKWLRIGANTRFCPICRHNLPPPP